MSNTRRHQPTPTTDRLCCVCERIPVHDAYTLCRDCSDDLSVELTKVCTPPRDSAGRPGRTLADELRITIAGIDRISSRNLGITVRSASTPLPWKEHASAALTALYDVLWSWASMTASRFGIHPELWPTPEAAAGWLLYRHNRVRQLDQADQAHDQIIGVVHQAEWAVDRPADREYAGPCDPECGGDVYGRPGNAFARCNTCSAEYPAAARRDWLLKASSDYLVTAAEASRALPDLLGRPLNVKTIRTWHNTGRLVMRGRDRDPDELDVGQAHEDDQRGAPLHRLGDIVELAVTTATRERGPKRHATVAVDAGASAPRCA
jgi:hypothetical protein